jgi:hypothetical protein
MDQIVKLKQPKSEAALVAEIRTLITSLAAAMTAADKCGIAVNFNVARQTTADLQSPFIVTELRITKQL